MRISPFLLAVVLGGTASAQTPGDSPLADLLNTPISTAAKYAQRPTDVAASVTVITAEEIARYGWHTLADVLNAVRGLYTTSDRGYTYLGVRGVGMPTEINSRVLLLIDGNPLIEVVSSGLDVGTGLALDLSTLERIELVRGPGSAMYGTGAMFGVINLITKDPDERAGAAMGIGSHGRYTGAVRAGVRASSLSAGVSISWQESEGQSLYFPEFDSTETNHGITTGNDYDDYRSVLATAAWGDLKLIALSASRTKGVPTAPWYTTFGDAVDMTDDRTLVAASFDRRLGKSASASVRAFLDAAAFEGTYPTNGSEWLVHTSSRRTGLEARYLWDIRPNHRIAVGTEYVASNGRYAWGTAAGAARIGERFSTLTTSIQLESELTSRLALTLGASYDIRESVDRSISPRAALVYRPTGRTTVKMLYGEAFRVPNVFELRYEDAAKGWHAAPDLEPETVRTHEVVVEHAVTADVLATLSVVDFHVRDLIRLEYVPDRADFHNTGSIRSRGAEFQLDYRRTDGIWSYLSLSRHLVRLDGERMINSPANSVRAGVSTPTSRQAFGALELQYQSGRRTFDGAATRGAFLTHLNVGHSLGRTMTLSVAVRNLFDTAYATPAGEEHRQDTLAQDGRTFLVRLQLRGR